MAQLGAGQPGKIVHRDTSSGAGHRSQTQTGQPVVNRQTINGFLRSNQRRDTRKESKKREKKEEKRPKFMPCKLRRGVRYRDRGPGGN
jgi:hypothetical protein